MQHNESDNVNDENFTESSANLAAAADDGFAEDKQTAEMEFAQTQYSPRGIVLLYFRGDPATEVDRHFSRTFAELCFPASSPEKSLEDSNFQGRTSIPMSQRNLPPSFWNSSHKNQPQHHQTSLSHHGNSGNIFQQKHNTMTPYDCNYQATGNHDNFSHPTGSNFVYTRTIPMSYAQLPTGTVKNLSPGPGPQIRVQPCHASTPSFPLESALQNSDLQPNSLRFDPSYNSLLVQPDVRPHLPHIPGEPSRTRTDARNDIQEGFAAELPMRKGGKLRSTSTKIYAFEMSTQDEINK